MRPRYPSPVIPARISVVAVAAQQGATAVEPEQQTRDDVGQEREDDDEGLGQGVGLVVGPAEEEVFGGGGDGAREEGEEGGVGYVEGGEEGEGVGGVALGAEDWVVRLVVGLEGG